MKLPITIALLFACIIHGTGQESFTMQSFLANARSQENVAYQKKRASFLTNISHELPMIEKLEIRTETNEFDWRKQEYVLRASPNSLSTIKAQRQYQETNRFMAGTELNAELGKALRERYDLLVSYLYSNRLLQTEQKKKVLFSDRLTLLQRSISLPGFDILDLIEAEDEEQESVRKILDLENTLRTIKKEIQLKIKQEGNVEIAASKWIDINDVKNMLASFVSPDPTEHRELNLLSAKIYNSMMEYEWEASKNKFSLGFVQAKYGYDPTAFRKSLSIGLGFDIPFKGAARLDLNELQVKTFELESRFINLKNILVARHTSLSQKLDNLLRKHDLVSLQLTDSQAEYALEEYSKIAEASPKTLLKMRENTLKKELIQQELEFEIMRAFVEFLDVSGLMTEQPFQNYLSKGKERF